MHLTNVYKSWKGGYKEDGTMLFSVVPSDRERRQWIHTWKLYIACKLQETHYCVDSFAVAWVVLIGFIFSFLVDLQILPRQPVLILPTWEKVLDHMTFVDLLQPWLFDFLILWLNLWSCEFLSFKTTLGWRYLIRSRQELTVTWKDLQTEKIDSSINFNSPFC